MVDQTFNKSRVIYDLSLIDPADFTDNVIICMSRFSWQVARTMLRGYGLRPTNYAVSYSEAGYETPSEAVFDLIDATISEFLGEDDMSCDLEDALLLIASAIDSLEGAIVSTGSCDTTCGEGGSFGAGTTGKPSSEFEDDGQNTFPPGFNNRGEYEAYKCDVANAIIASIQADATWLLTANIVTLTATAMVAAFLTPIPFDDILVLVGVAVALVAQGLLAGAAQEIINYITANAETLVCILFDAADASEAETNLENNFSAGLGITASTIVGSMINSDNMNPLFEKDTLFENNGATMSVDCVNCSGVCTNVIGVKVSDNGSTIVLEFEQPGNIASILFNSDGSVTGHCGQFYTLSNIQVISGTITPPGGQNEAWRFYSIPPTPNSNGDVFTSDVTPGPLDTFDNVAWVVLRSTTQAQVSFDYVPFP